MFNRFASEGSRLTTAALTGATLLCVPRTSDTVIRALGGWPGANQREGVGPGAIHGESSAKAVPSTTSREDQGNLSNQTDVDSKGSQSGPSAKGNGNRVNPAYSFSVAQSFDQLYLPAVRYVGGWPRVDRARFSVEAPLQVKIASAVSTPTLRGMQNRLGARAGAIPEKTAAITAASQLIPQAHGGALLTGGTIGQRGGAGRPKESLRIKMRSALETTLEALSAALAGERLTSSASEALLTDPRVAALGADVVATLADVCRDHLTARLSTRELTQIADTLARYGVGTQQEKEETKTQVRYVIHLPARRGDGRV